MCTNTHCTDHVEDIERYTMDVLETISTVAVDTLLMSGGGGGTAGHKQAKPGWSEFVKPYSDESKFWNSLWESAGKPRYGSLFEAMKQTKHQYKYAVRRLNRASDSIQNGKFVNSLVDGGVDIFREIKKCRGSVATCSSRIDDEVGSANISNYFAGIYSDLYRKVELGHQFEELCMEINLEVGEAQPGTG